MDKSLEYRLIGMIMNGLAQTKLLEDEQIIPVAEIVSKYINNSVVVLPCRVDAELLGDLEALCYWKCVNNPVDYRNTNTDKCEHNE